MGARIRIVRWDIYCRVAGVSCAACILEAYARAWDSYMILMLFSSGASEHGGVLV